MTPLAHAVVVGPVGLVPGTAKQQQTRGGCAVATTMATDVITLFSRPTAASQPLALRPLLPADTVPVVELPAPTRKYGLTQRLAPLALLHRHGPALGKGSTRLVALRLRTTTGAVEGRAWHDGGWQC